ncbi:hypothetical protein [Apilactobacillus xinyiensis]|uniref:hypothetical protein n=1 Tax=Apilactobacillus xinyiensis TaxID=2841032 RepID=UPI00200E1B3C|nr:hypothetical protein [Apilactobacillus xinyiensis]MCL0319417.1 hypothetical protein [Apilactobacillus xinyiensis]
MNTFLGAVVSGTVIASFITNIINIYLNRAKINSDVKSKSRIDWLNNLREDTARYIESLLKFESNKGTYPYKSKEYYDYIYNLTKLMMYFNNIEKNGKKHKRKADVKYLQELKEYRFLASKVTDNIMSRDIVEKSDVSLQELGFDNLNDFFNGYIEKMCKLLRYPYDNEHKNIYILEMLATDYDMISSDCFDYDILSIVSRTREVLSIYSKIEWDKAKKGK